MTWSNLFTCPICHAENCVPPYGPEDSPVLLVGESPSSEEVLQGRPFVGRTGTILEQQLRKFGWNVQEFRMCNLWQHDPNKNSECLDDGKATVVKEAAGRKAILLVGSDTVSAFTDYKVSDVCGLPIKSPYFSAELIMGMYNPAIVFHSVLGEVQLTIRKFLRSIEKYYE